MEELELSQQEMAELLHCSQATVSWKLNERSPVTTLERKRLLSLSASARAQAMLDAGEPAVIRAELAKGEEHWRGKSMWEFVEHLPGCSACLAFVVTRVSNTITRPRARTTR